MNNVPPLDLSRQYALIGEEVNAAVLEVLASGRYIGGPVVESFEKNFASYLGVSQCVGCNSGTDALFLALRALKIGPLDEVITTPFTFVATAEMISAVGATPVFVDIDADTFNLDLEKLESAITSKTRAILPVHLFGQPMDMTRLMAIASSHGLAVIEDCAQSTGAEWAGQKVGSIGHVGCFSFFPTKNLGACGDGGAVATNDPAIASSVRMLKEHGQSDRYYCEATGINSRLDALQATILQIKLRYLNTWNAQRRAAADRYYQLLSHLPEVALPQELPGGQGVWNQYTIRIKSQENYSPSLPLSQSPPPPVSPSPSLPLSQSPPPPVSPSPHLRDSVRTQLQEGGLGSMVYYPLPLHLQPVYKSLGYPQGSFPVAEQACCEVLSLPIFPELSREQQDRVIYGLKDCLTRPTKILD